MSDQAEADEPEESETEQAGLQEGDFVELAYTAYTVDSGELVDTTDEEVAEEEGVDTEDQEFSPRTLVIGEGHIFEAVEDDLVGKEVGDTGSVVAELPFGEFEEDEVRTVSSEKLDEEDRYPGAHVNVDGESGHVEAVIGGRARVDFNHPLAGDDVEYEYEVVREVTDREEQASGLLKMMFDVDLDVEMATEEVEEEVEDSEASATPQADGEAADGETETETVEEEVLYVEQAPELQYSQEWMMGKDQFLRQVIDMLGIDRVVVQEVIEERPGGMMGGMGGMGGTGGEDLGDVEEALEDADVDADEIVEELEGEADVEDLDEE